MTDPVVLVTGGNNGIGYYTCLEFAKQGGVHVIMGSRSRERGDEAAASIREQIPAASISVITIDVNSDESIEAAVKEIGAQHGRVDTLINNAGVCPTEMSRPLFRECFETNVFGSALVTRAFVSLLRKAAPARVIYVTSGLGSIGARVDPSDVAYEEDYKVYRMSKAALNMLAVCDAWEYKADGILVFTMCPGFVTTDLAGMRKAKEDMGVPLPTKRADGLWAIHSGRQDSKTAAFLESKAIMDGGSAKPW